MSKIKILKMKKNYLKKLTLESSLTLSSKKKSFTQLPFSFCFQPHPVAKE